MQKISVENAEHYKWGNNCDGWHLVKSEGLTVIRERMPPNTAEQLHFHHKAQQLFYILSGEACFEIEDGTVRVAANEALHISPLIRHCISNRSNADLHFLVISAPESHGDRTNL